MNKGLATVLVVAAGTAGAWLFTAREQSGPPAASNRMDAGTEAGDRAGLLAGTTARDPQVTPETEPSAPAPLPGSPLRSPETPRQQATETALAPGAVPTQPRAVRFSAPAGAEGAAVEEPIVPAPLAFAALKLVGVDPAAQKIWERAINDPATSSTDRGDLIEDLNETGFPDPSNVTMIDLPLILARIKLIEELAPFAMDEVNAAAFEEAYKDLLDMLVALRSKG